MLSKDQIQQALHASRVVPLPVTKSHGLLGLEQLVVAASRLNPARGSEIQRVHRTIVLGHETWEKLEQLTETITQTTSKHVTALQVAAAIIERFVATLPQQNETQE